MKSKLLNKNKIYLAILIGFSISGYLVYAEVSKTNFMQTWETIHFSSQTFTYLCLAIVMMLFRDLGYVLRIRLLTDKKLNWRQSIKVILMWEFASAVSPGVVGGSAVAMFILKKEKINLGNSTAIVFTTALPKVPAVTVPSVTPELSVVSTSFPAWFCIISLLSVPTLGLIIRSAIVYSFGN